MAFLNQRAEGIAREKTVTLEEEKNKAEDALVLAEIAQKNAEKANLAKSEFLSTINHELRTPLTSIIGGIQMIHSGRFGALTDDMAKLLEIASRNSTRLTSLINDILDLSKIEAGHLEMSLEPLSSADLLRRAQEENEIYGTKYEVEIVISNNEEAQVYGDHKRITQVLTNLVSNAAKFSDEDTKVELSTKVHGDFVRFSVKDYGVGISDEFKTKIFSPFTQEDSSDSRKMGGTGLGLNISKSIVEQMGGIISFDTEVGVGTTFYFELPLVT